jgi:hypothetical protein
MERPTPQQVRGLALVLALAVLWILYRLWRTL